MTAQCTEITYFLYFGKPYNRGSLKIFGTPWLRSQLLFPKFFMGFYSDWHYERVYKILPVSEIIGVHKKFPALPGYAHTLYSPEKNRYAYHTDYSTLYVNSFSRDFWLEFLVGLRTQPIPWGRGGCMGSGMVPFERALVSCYRPSIVTFPLYAFQRYCRFCSAARHFFPTPSLP